MSLATSTSLLGGAIQGNALSPTGIVTTAAGSRQALDGIGSAAAFNHPGGITSDGTNLYVTDSDNSTVRKIVLSTGAVSTFAGDPGIVGYADGVGTSARFDHPGGLAIVDSYLYVADTGGSTIRKIDLSTRTVTTVGGVYWTGGSSNGVGYALFKTPVGVATDGSNLYVADTGNHSIRKMTISSGAWSTIAGAAGTAGSDDGAGMGARFNSPEGLVCDGQYLYVSDTGNNTIRKIALASGVVTTVSGAVGKAGTVDGVGTAARFDAPKGMASDGEQLYVADANNSSIRKINLATGAVTTLAGTSGQPGFTDGDGAAAGFKRPAGISKVGDRLVVADTGNSAIRQIMIATALVSTVAGNGSYRTTDDGTGVTASFERPYGVTADGVNLYVADTYNHTIRQIVIATGVVHTLAGASGFRGASDGVGTAARFAGPRGITTDGAYIYVADTGNNTIRKIAVSSGAVATIAGMAGVQGASDGPGNTASFNAPAALSTDGVNLYVADASNHTIRKISLATKVVSTIAGTAGVTGSADGVGQIAKFYCPQGITTDGKNLYVVDSYNNSIRVIEISTGSVTTIAGVAGVYGSADGAGPAAQFRWPIGITTDGANLYATDAANGTIRKIGIASGVATTIAGASFEIGYRDGTGAEAKFQRPAGITTDGKHIYVVDTYNSMIRRIK